MFQWLARKFCKLSGRVQFPSFPLDNQYIMKLNKQKIVKILQKMIEDKRLVQKYMKGEAIKEDLDKRGIKLVKLI